MKRSIAKTVTEVIEIQTPCFRKCGSSYYMITDDLVIKVCNGTWPELNTLPVVVETPWNESAEDSTELEFYTAYAATRNALDIAANVESLQLDQRYMDMVAEECRHDNEPDHEEREHMEEMEYRSSQMGSI